MSQELEARVIELESIVSYQDQMLEDLNQIVIKQQWSVDDLQKKIEQLNKSVTTVQDSMNDKPPPHY